MTPYEVAIAWLVGGSIVMFVASLIFLPLLVVRLPCDYFTNQAAPRFAKRRPIVRVLLIVSKNLLGTVLLGGGILMLFLPGQGILAILIGLALLDIPGAQRIKMRLLGQPKVIAALNKLRRMARRDPLQTPCPQRSPPDTGPDSQQALHGKGDLR